MQVIAKLNYLRTAPRKVRLVCDVIRGKNVTEAKDILKFSVKKPTRTLAKLLDSAIANAKNDFDLKEEDLKISEVKVDEGPKLKRWRPRSRGRAMQIQKKTSHITLVLEPIKKESEPIKKKEKEIKKRS